MAQPYDPHLHPTPPWTWRDDPTWGAGNGHWELHGSSNVGGPSVSPHSYECVQYTLAKINGRRPHHSDPAEFPQLIAALTQLGFRQHACAQCGCGAGQCRECVAIYYQGTSPFHAAVFDRQLCDWGGKANNRDGILRYKSASDYCRAGETVVCWCREPAGPYISDERINLGALTAEEAAQEQAGDALFAALLRLIRWLFGWLRRWWPF